VVAHDLVLAFDAGIGVSYPPRRVMANWLMGSLMLVALLPVAGCSSSQSPEHAVGGAAGKAANSGAAGSAAPMVSDGGDDGGASGASGFGGAAQGTGGDGKAGTTTTGGAGGIGTASGGASGAGGASGVGGIGGAGGGASGAGGAGTCNGTQLNKRLDLECPENGRCVCRTYAPSEGDLVLDTSTNSNMSIISFPLPEPMKAGELYSLSATMTSYAYTGAIEFWGTNSVCGPGLQKLYGEPVESRTYCADVTPTQDFTHVLLVKRLLWSGHGSAGASEGPVYACGSNRCPATP